MTVESSSRLERRFVRERLPWLVGAAGLVVYLITLHHWVSLSSLPLVTRVNGWNWQPLASEPLLWLLTLPFRALPAAWVPLALNLLTAVCASLTLATLARSVALLPHDRLEEQRLLVRNEHALLSVPEAWVPMVLAAVALGLQLTFWEHAITATGEMLDLLLFGYIIRCLLEYRVDERQSWLDRGAVLFGVGMANNWGMVPFLPLFVVAVLRTKRLGFFSIRAIRRMERSGMENALPALYTDLRFFLRLTLLVLAGLSLLLLLPLLQALSPDSTLTFWQALRSVLASYWANFQFLGSVFLRFRRDLALLLAAASLLPVLLLSIRWGASAGGETHAKFDLAAFISHLAYAFLLLICFCTVFDPPFSPRQVSRQSGLLLPFLPLYYLTALSVGYYSGFFLLVFGSTVLERTSSRRAIRCLLCRIVPKVVYVMLGVALVGLLLENVPAIRAINARHLSQYARLAASALPPEGAIVLSDDPARLGVFQAELAREGKAERYVPVDTRKLQFAAYRSWLSKKYPGRWPNPEAEVNPLLAGLAVAQTNSSLDVRGQALLLSQIGQSNRLYCLQPSLGFMFEVFYLQPHGLLHELKIYSAEYLSEPPLAAEEVTENQRFWQDAIETGINPVLQLTSQSEIPRPELAKRLMKLGHLQTPPPIETKVLASWYSSALNRWGVTLQRNNRLKEATPYFTLAGELKPENVAARVNLQCNADLLARRKLTVFKTPTFLEQLGKSRSLAQIVAENGPFDEPSYCYHLAEEYKKGGLLRQPCQLMDRVKTLVPDDLSVRLALGDLFNKGLQSPQALKVVNEIRTDPGLTPLAPADQVNVTLLEARVYLARTNTAVALGIIYALLATHPRDAFAFEGAVSSLTAYKCYTDALRVADQQLQFAPNDPVALANKGNLCVLTKDYSNAIPPLTLSLSLTNSPGARINRALAYLRTGRLGDAEADCQQVTQDFPAAYRVYYALGEVAWEKKDTNAAIRHYERYLSEPGIEIEEALAAAARLRSLRQGRF